LAGKFNTAGDQLTEYLNTIAGKISPYFKRGFEFKMVNEPCLNLIDNYDGYAGVKKNIDSDNL